MTERGFQESADPSHNYRLREKRREEKRREEKRREEKREKLTSNFLETTDDVEVTYRPLKSINRAF